MRSAASSPSVAMITTRHSPRLIFISEPEAAIIYFAARDTSRLNPGDMVTVVDSGGGTTDISTYVVGIRNLTEISSRNGMNDAGLWFILIIGNDLQFMIRGIICRRKFP
jgi:hypothetical protein